MIVDSECDSDCDDEQEDGDREQEVDRRQHPQDQRVRARESEYCKLLQLYGGETL